MKRIFFCLFFVAAVTVWCSPGFARQSIGAGSVALSVDGSLNGVDITGISTLLVNTSVVAAPDIFTSNVSLATVPLAVSTTASQGTIWFQNSSTVYGDVGISGARFLDIKADDGTTVNFLGSVFTTTLHAGTGTMNFKSGTTNIAAGGITFTGDGTIGLSANTTLIGAIVTNTDQTGTLSLAGGSVLDGAVGGPAAAAGLRAINVVGGSNTAGVSATITGAVNAYTFSLGTNTLNIGGALIIADNSGPGGVINTTLASSTVYGHIVPTGLATLGGNVGINVLVPSTSYIPVGTQFDIVQATSGSDGSVVTVTVQNPTNPLYTFSAVPLAGTVAGLVTIKTDSIPIQTSPLPVVTVLLDVPTTPDLQDVLAAINALTDPDAITNATAQLNPSTPALVMPLLTFQGTRQFQDLWLSRLDICSQVSHPDKENASCSGNVPHSGWWAKGFGYVGDQDARENSTGYSSRIIGSMIGYDMPLGLGTRAGLGVGYARGTIKGKTFDANASSDTYQGTAYIGHEQGPWFVNGSASFGWNEYASMRHIVFPGMGRTANAEYSGQDYTAFMDTGYHLPVAKFTVTPLASLQYSRVNISGYTEKDAGDVNLKVNSQGYDFLESGLGVKLERSFNYRGGTIVPEAHVKWLHDFLNPQLAQTAAFTAPGSSEFTTQGHRTADDTYDAGAGLMLLSCACGAQTWSIESVYDYNWRNDGYSAHQVMVRFTDRF